MVCVDLSIRVRDGRVVVMLSGGLDEAHAATVAAARRGVAAREREMIVDPAGLECSDTSGVAALVACARAGPAHQQCACTAAVQAAGERPERLDMISAGSAVSRPGRDLAWLRRRGVPPAAGAARRVAVDAWAPAVPGRLSRLTGGELGT